MDREIYDIYKVLGNVNEFKRVRGIKDNDNINQELNKLLQNESNKTFGLRTTRDNSIGSLPKFKTYSFEQFMQQLN